MPDLSEIKTCIGCMEIKTLADCYFNKKDNCFFARCKECTKSASRQRFKNKQKEIQEQRKEYNRAYRKTPRGREVDREIRRRTIAKHKEKHRARDALKQKGIPPARTKKCVHCGNQAHSYHHHNGYSREYRFDVIPLCLPCHTKADKLQRSQKSGSGM